MSREQEADCLALLAQRMSLKDVADTVGVWEWDVANLFRPCRRRAPPAPARTREAA